VTYKCALNEVNRFFPLQSNSFVLSNRTLVQIENIEDGSFNIETSPETSTIIRNNKSRPTKEHPHPILHVIAK
jgi:hypothetical protein